MKNIYLVILILLSCSVSYAADNPDPQTKPATKIEAFTAKTGAVLIRGFSEIGEIRGTGTVSVDAREFRDASNPKSKEKGIAFTVEESGRLERSSISFVDYDEITSLLAGIDYISKVDGKVTSLSNFEASYKTKGDFSITTFSSSKGGINAVVASGRIGRTKAYITTSDLDTLRSLILKAKEKIDAIK